MSIENKAYQRREVLIKYISLILCFVLFSFGLYEFFGLEPRHCKPVYEGDCRNDNEWAQVAAVWFIFPTSVYFGVLYMMFKYQFEFRWHIIGTTAIAIIGLFLSIF